MIVELYEISICSVRFLCSLSFRLQRKSDDNSSVFVGYVWAIFLNFVGLFSRDENFVVGFFEALKIL